MRDDGIFDGDLVAVQRTRDARNGQVVVARIDGEVTIKRFEQTRAQIRLLPRNPDYAPIVRSEEHTSELQSLMRISYAVFCLKKKNTTQYLSKLTKMSYTAKT